MSVFEYGCENEGLNHTRVLIHPFTENCLTQRLLTTRQSRAKQGFMLYKHNSNKKVETYEVITERNIEIFLVRVYKRVWTIELSIRRGHVSNVRSGN